MTQDQTQAEKQILTNSRASAFKECPRKHFWLYEAGIRPIKTEPPLRFGSQFHLGLETYAKTGDLSKAIGAAIERYSFYPQWIQTEDDQNAFNDERTVLVELLAGHINFWSEYDPIQIIKPESTFYVPIVNPDTGKESRLFQSAGQRDAIGTWRGKLKLIEYKTTSADLSPESVYWQRLLIDPQISHYNLATLQENIPIDGVLYDVSRKPLAALSRRLNIPLLDPDGLKILIWKLSGERVKNKDGSPAQRCPSGQTESVDVKSRLETIEEHGARIREDIQTRPDWYFQRREIARSTAEIQDYQRELWQIAHSINFARKNKIWYKNGNICFRYYSTRPCPYWDACTLGIDLLELSAGRLHEMGFEKIADVHPELNEKEID